MSIHVCIQGPERKTESLPEASNSGCHQDGTMLERTSGVMYRFMGAGLWQILDQWKWRSLGVIAACPEAKVSYVRGLCRWPCEPRKPPSAHLSVRHPG